MVIGNVSNGLPAKEMLKSETITFDEEQLQRECSSCYSRFVKHIIDTVLALIGIVVLSPVILIISIAIVAESGFPILYRAERGGYHGKTFKICKFRTMVQNADKIGGGTTALNDSRITKVGALLRRFKFDEIVQLFNIIGQTMSFIGPRPELVRYTSQYDDLEKHILDVRPGITDYSSIEFINLDEIVGEENADEAYEKYVLKQKNQLRLKYVSTISFQTDVKLFFGTVFQVLRKICRAIAKQFRPAEKITTANKGEAYGVHNSEEF